MIANIHDLRRRGMVAVTIGGWLVVVALAILAVTHGSNALIALIISAMLNLIPTWCSIKGRTDPNARIAIGVMAALQPALMLFAMQGAALQIDTHLYFFVALAALTLLWDIRPIMIACALILVHHVALSYLAPNWLFFGGSGPGRVLVHAFATGLIGTLLCWITLCLSQMMKSIEQARETSDTQTARLKETGASLKKALAKLEAEQAANANTRAEIIEVRKSEYQNVAAQFESSISDVTHAVAATANLLERSAKELKSIADLTGKEAHDVANRADAASRSASTVAAGVAEMSLSIANIAVNVGQQSALTAKATDRSGGGGQAIGSLSQQSQTIGEATRAIVRIAQRTDLLSLNAAIEAASAGPAGRGFTIVAHEVKALASQAAEAATEIDAFLSGVYEGTVEAERSFAAIDTVIADLNKAARSISYDVENQRQSADTIEEYARNAASEADAMAGRTKVLSERASAARDLSDELEHAAAALAENVRNLERSTEEFMGDLKAA